MCRRLSTAEFIGIVSLASGCRCTGRQFADGNRSGSPTVHTHTHGTRAATASRACDMNSIHRFDQIHDHLKSSIAPRLLLPGAMRRETGPISKLRGHCADLVILFGGPRDHRTSAGAASDRSIACSAGEPKIHCQDDVVRARVQNSQRLPLCMGPLAGPYLHRTKDQFPYSKHVHHACTLLGVCTIVGGRTLAVGSLSEGSTPAEANRLIDKVVLHPTARRPSNHIKDALAA